MYKLEKRCGKTNQIFTIKEFNTKKDVIDFVIKQDAKLQSIHNKQRELYGTTSKFVFFNVYAQDFLKYGNVINWYSTFNKNRTSYFYYSLKGNA